MIYVGSARIDEHGNISGGAAGDQTGREVCTEPYYLHSQGWNLIRAKDAKIADKIANAMLEACHNDNIGYDQWQRETIVGMYKKYGSIGRIKEKCECDCSLLIRMCVWQATGKDPGNFTTGNAVQMLEATGFFANAVPVTDNMSLYDGDILCTKTKGHIVAVVSGNPRKQTTTEVQNGTKTAAKATAIGDVYIRAKATKESLALGVLKKGSVCKLLGKTSVNGDITWERINFNGLTGWCSKKYLKEK